jgi:O-antigen/teichoic acid export membrane protein
LRKTFGVTLSTRIVPQFVRRLVPHGVGTLASATVVGQLSTLAVLPLLTRWCTVNDLGLLQLYVSITAFLGLVACLRYDYAVLQAADHPTAGRLVVLSLLLALGAGVITLAVLPAMGWAFGTQGWHDLNRVSLLVGVAVTSTGMTSAATNWLVRNGRFQAVAHARMIQSLSQSGLQAAGAFAGFGGTGLIVGDAVSRIIGLLLMLFVSALLPYRPSGRAGVSALWHLARDYRRFPFIAAPSGLINAAGFSLPIFFLERVYGTSGVGVYSLLERVMSVPSLFAGQPLSQTFIYRLREAFARSPAAARSEIWGTTRVTALLGLVPFLALTLAGPFLFSLVFGEQWRMTGELARWLAPLYFVAYVVWPVMPTLTLLNHLRAQMVWDIARAVALIGTVIVAERANIQLRTTIGSLAMLGVVFGAVNFWLCLNSTRELGSPVSAS